MTDISPERYEQVLNQILEAQEQSDDLIIRARCAPHFQRIAHQRNPDSVLTRAEGYDGSSCIAGTHYCRITPEGGVTACPYIADEVDNIRDKSFLDIWDNNAVFKQLRTPHLLGKCGQCEYRALCGGCRARAMALEGDLMNSDPWCNYVPEGSAIIEPYREQKSEVQWSPQAMRRLSRVPGFLRKMIKKRTEDYVREQHEQMVTPEHMTTLVQRRFGSKGPPGIKPNSMANVTALRPRKQTGTHL